MIYIKKKKEKDVRSLVVAIFILAFFLFLFIRPNNYTGMATLGSLSISDVNVGQSINTSDSFTINIESGDSFLCNAPIKLIIKKPSGTEFFSGQITLNDLIINNGGTCSEPYTTVGSLTTNIKTIFSGIGNFDEAGTSYVLSINFSNTSNSQKAYSSDTFDVISVTSNPPSVGSVSFSSVNGDDEFKVKEKINCSSTITDSDSSSVTISYKFWDGDDEDTSYNTGTMACSGTSWSSGKLCTISLNITQSHIGQWVCTVKAEDGSNTISDDSSIIEMKNSAPVLTQIIENATWPTNTNYTDIQLDDYFSDPDNQNMNYSVRGNSSIKVEIASNGNVKLIPSLDWTGIEKVIFSATDSKNSKTDSNEVTLNVTDSNLCESSWSCSNWTECSNGNQTRTCTDINTCDPQTSLPVLTQVCSVLASCDAGDACMIDCVSGDSDCSCNLQGGYLCGPSLTCKETSLLHSGSGECCSKPCTSNINTNVGAGQNSGFGTSTNKILVGVGTIAGIVFVATLIILLVTYLRRKNAKVEETAITNPGKPLEQKPEIKEIAPPTTTVKIKPINYDKMKEYIKTALESKVQLKDIKSELQKAGWSEKDIDNELTMARLRSYVKLKINQGVSPKDIESSLKMKGWKREQIKEAMEEAKLRPLF